MAQIEKVKKVKKTGMKKFKSINILGPTVSCPRPKKARFEGTSVPASSTGYTGVDRVLKDSLVVARGSCEGYSSKGRAEELAARRSAMTSVFQAHVQNIF
jgi:hypothetical protein